MNGQYSTPFFNRWSGKSDALYGLALPTIFFAAAIAIFIFVFYQGETVAGLIVPVLVTMMFCVVYVLFIWQILGNRYIMTTAGIRIDNCLLFHTSRYIPLPDITDISLHQWYNGRTTIIIHRATCNGRGDPMKETIHAVPDADIFLRDLNEILALNNMPAIQIRRV